MTTKLSLRSVGCAVTGDHGRGDTSGRVLIGHSLRSAIDAGLPVFTFEGKCRGVVRVDLSGGWLACDCECHD